MKKDLTTLLESLYACQDAQEWAVGKTVNEAWETCEHYDWYVWLYKRLNPLTYNKKVILELNMEILGLVLPLLSESELKTRLTSFLEDHVKNFKDFYTWFEPFERGLKYHAETTQDSLCITIVNKILQSYDSVNHEEAFAFLIRIILTKRLTTIDYRKVLSITRKYLPLEIYGLEKNMETT